LTNFKKYFIYGDVTDNLEMIYDDVLSIYKGKKLSPISNYMFKPAEMILGNIYRSAFDMTENESMFQIKEEKDTYFLKKLQKKLSPKETIDYDLRLDVEGLESPVYIRYTDKLPGHDISIPFRFESVNDGVNLTKKLVRKGRTGEDVYMLSSPSDMRATKENGREIIHIKAFETRGKGKEIHPYEGFEKNLSYLINSFGNSITAMVPGMLHPDIKSKHTKSGYIPLARTTYTRFAKFYDYYNANIPQKVDSDWFNAIKPTILSDISKKQYASWEKSLDFIAARIPSQSMQSFMPMRNIAYMKNSANDVFVSVMQIWMQGSDFL
jgi:hypothetical protein